MKTNLLIAAFAVMVAAQLAVPAGMILDREATLRQGAVYRFRTQPVDPYDPFRGRYVWLRLEPDSVPAAKGMGLDDNLMAYAVLGTDADGFATVETLSDDRPEEGDYVRVHTYQYGAGDVYITWPIDRYYMEERLAPEAERAHRADPAEAWAQVRVLRGKAVLEELYIDGEPAADYARAHLDGAVTAP